MKKLMFGMAAALALCGMAIESSNVVGYNTKAVEAGKFAILGPQFETIKGTTDINGIISGVTGVSQDEYGEDFVKVAPHIQVPNATTGGYDLYYYLTDGYYATGEKDADGEDVYGQKPGWCDAGGIIAGETISDVTGELIPAVAIWIRDTLASETFIQKGQVPNVSSVKITAPATFALRSSPYPESFNLNDTNKVTFEGLKGVSQDELGDEFIKFAPHIQVPNPETGGYDLYYYLTDGYYATGEKDADGEDVYGQKPGWCDAGGIIAGEEIADATGIVPIGFGFWTKGVGGEFSITFKK